jgi:hypothetical protein
MYTIAILALLFVLPLASTGLDILRAAAPATSYYLPAVLLKWFVFWGVGVRLLAAGYSRMTQPRRTADLLGLKHDDALFPIRELGFANTAMGLVGAMSVLFWTFRLPSGVMGAVFYGLAGFNHRSTGQGTGRERVAMLGDLAFAAVLLVLSFVVWRHGR